MRNIHAACSWTCSTQHTWPVQGALVPAEAQTAMTELQSDAPGVLYLAPPPPQLPGLMRHNPGLAAQLLLRLADMPEVGWQTGVPLMQRS